MAAPPEHPPCTSNTPCPEQSWWGGTTSDPAWGRAPLRCLAADSLEDDGVWTTTQPLGPELVTSAPSSHGMRATLATAKSAGSHARRGSDAAASSAGPIVASASA